jgi:hypothetical protein
VELQENTVGKFWVQAAACVLLVGCASPATGVVPIGSGLYMASNMDQYGGWSGGTVKAALYREAMAFCSKQGKTSLPITSKSEDAGIGRYASAEITFKCE